MGESQGEIKVITRGPEPEDHSFIIATWLNGQRYSNPFYERQDPKKYFAEHGDYINEVLVTPGMDIRIACDEACPYWIAGFSVHKGDTLYWVHVKEDYRKRGIAALLLQGTDIKTVKGLTNIGWYLLQKYGWSFETR